MKEFVLQEGETLIAKGNAQKGGFQGNNFINITIISGKLFVTDRRIFYEEKNIISDYVEMFYPDIFSLEQKKIMGAESIVVVMNDGKKHTFHASGVARLPIDSAIIRKAYIQYMAYKNQNATPQVNTVGQFNQPTTNTQQLASSEILFCQYCGTKFSHGDNFCSNCGKQR